VCILGTLNVGIFYPALFVTSHLMPGGVAAVLNSGVPLVVMLAAPLYGDRAAGWRLGWAILGIAGVALVARPTDQVNGLGIVAGLVAMTALAMAVVLSKRWGHPPGTGVWLLSGWQLTAGGCVLLPFALLEGVPRDLGPETVAAYLWLGGVAGLVAYAAWFAGIRRLDAAGVAAIGLVSPVVAMALGLLVDERPSSWQVLGAALVLSSALLCQRSFAPGPEVTVMPSVDGVPRHPSRTAALAPQPRPAGRPDQAEPDDYA
jgi:probable blue pigment (indigoidine) exporter